MTPMQKPSSICLRLRPGWIASSLLILSLLLLCPCTKERAVPAEILWDTWGIPHIYSDNNEGLFYAFGWAQMESHGDLILRLYGQARGRAAEYWGESHIDSDRYVRTMGVPERAREWYLAQRPPFRQYLDAFTEGMNAFAKAHRDHISDEVEVVLPVDAVDVLAHLQRAIHLAFVGSQIVREAQRWGSSGSNAWAIAPSRSASGNAMLLANPHLPWSDLYMFYEAQLISPEINASGVTFVGLPLPVIAFNDYLGWTHTVNTIDGMDMYELMLSGEGYLMEGAVHSFDQETQVLKVKKEDGRFRNEKLVVRRSVHGPVLSKKGSKALAVRMVGFDQPHLFEQYWEMLRSKNLAEFEAALQRLQLPLFNVIYADRDGHILYFFGGLVPKRARGNWNYWQRIIPGVDSTTVWTETHPYSDLPRIVDPPSGWVQNANDPPWTATFPTMLDPDDFPSYMSPQSMSFRPQRSARMLAEDDSITFEELVQRKQSTRMELADRLLDDLIPAARQHGSELTKRAADVLEAWDRKADAESRGAVLFAAWVPEVGRDLFAVPWSEKAPRSTPDGLADPVAAVAALEKAAENVLSDFEVLDVPWGQVHRLRYSGRDLPASGGPGWMGIFRVLSFSRDPDSRYRCTFRESYVAAVEFCDPPRAMALLSYGNSSQPRSVHKGDQLELFSRKELRPVWRTREAIEAHLEKKKVF